MPEPYPWTVPKPKKDPDRPDSGAAREEKILWALNGLVDAPGPVMVTSWVAIIEYMDKEGTAQLAALASNMPSWRMTGMIDSGREMLLEDLIVEDYGDYDDD
jgi:hypothetical protein